MRLRKNLSDSTNSDSGSKSRVRDEKQNLADADCTVEHEYNVSQYRQITWILLLGISLRLFSAHFFAEFFEKNPQFSTPWSSIKRLREGVFLYESGHTNIYDGDLFHVLPMFIHLLRPSLHRPVVLWCQWILIDVLTAYMLSQFVLHYISARCTEFKKKNEEEYKTKFEESKWLTQLAFAGYMLNPMVIGCWTVYSLASAVNALISMSIYGTLKRSLLFSILPLAFAIQLNPYYAILFAPIFVQFTAGKRIAAILFAISSTITIFTANLLIWSEGHTNQDLLRNTFGFFLTVPDFTPNSGLFWYFFAQIFEHYRLLFLCAFQLNAIVYVVPFSALLRQNPALLSTMMMIIVALFSPYPSYAETALYLPTLAAFFELHKYLRQRLVMGCALLATFVLSPVMWSMWVISGSGNANFFFAIVLVFSLAQIFISADLISAHLRAQIIRESGGDEEVEKRFEGLRLVSVSPF